MKLKIATHSGLEYETLAETFDPQALDEKLNDTDVNTVLIGDIIISRIDIKLVMPIKEEEVELDVTE
ncbi:hypothetical protein MHI57_24515 [Cytobacillus sp. FSL K6-0129]|uniref:hypothetical protein n=1 Tax=unclassified Cytobacillus TaxID=2675268 RepID=UPI0030FA7413